MPWCVCVCEDRQTVNTERYNGLNNFEKRKNEEISNLPVVFINCYCDSPQCNMIDAFMAGISYRYLRYFLELHYTCLYNAWNWNWNWNIALRIAQLACRNSEDVNLMQNSSNEASTTDRRILTLHLQNFRFDQKMNLRKFGKKYFVVLWRDSHFFWIEFWLNGCGPGDVHMAIYDYSLFNPWTPISYCFAMCKR